MNAIDSGLRLKWEALSYYSAKWVDLYDTVGYNGRKLWLRWVAIDKFIETGLLNGLHRNSHNCFSSSISSNT